MKHLIIISIYLLAAAFHVQAKLNFEYYTLSDKIPEDAQAYAFEYKFENAGAGPVTIESVKTSCGCTVAAPEKKTYQPGEAGIIKGVFNIGGRTGKQRNIIQLFTDDLAQSQIDLKLDVEIVRAVTITPRLLYWKAGETSPKTVTIQTIPGLDSGVTDIEFNSPDFEVTAHRCENTALLEKVEVTPKKPNIQNLRQTLKLISKSQTGEKREHLIHLLIKE